MKQRVVDHIVGHLSAIGVDYIFDVDGPSVVSIECAADEIPPFATFLEPSVAKNLVCQDITQENRTDVAVSV
jgi:hypothetical protein